MYRYAFPLCIMIGLSATTLALAEEQMAVEEQVDPQADGDSQADDERLWRFSWDRGIEYGILRPKVMTLQHRPQVPLVAGRIGTMLQLDGASYDERSTEADFTNRIRTRRARLYTNGRFYLRRPFNYKVQLGYETNEWVVHDFVMDMQDIPYINSFKIGYFKVPITMSGIESGRDLSMLERPAVVNAFWDNRRLGMTIGGTENDGLLNWQMGLFSFGKDFENSRSDDGDVKFAARLSGLPSYSEEGDSLRSLVHLGFNLQYAYAFDDEESFSSRPESRFAPIVIDTGSFDADNTFIVGQELAILREQFSFKAEILQTYVETATDDHLFHGGYLTLGFMLTDDFHHYQKDKGCFGLLRPNRKVSLQNGNWGAFELIAHASYLDLSDKSLRGGKLNVVGTGLKWYLTDTLQIHTNLQYADVYEGGIPGSVWIFQSRLQLAL